MTTQHQHQLNDIATRDVTCLSADASIGEAARIMAQRRFSSIVITDEAHHPVGIVTERNVMQAMRSGSSPETLLRTCMSAPVVVISGAANCLDAYQTCMREGIRHLVVVDEGGAVAGVVSETDFRQHLNLTALAGRRKVIMVAQRSVSSLPPQGSLMQALNLMQSQRETCVVVVEDAKPVGIVTERDVVRFYAREPDRVSVPLAELMAAPVLTITSDATINQAAELMLEKKVRHLVVVDATGRMAGLVSEHDLTQTMALGLLDEKAEVEEAFLHTIMNTIPDLVWLKDVDGVFISCNKSFGRLVGLKEADIIGKTDYDLVERGMADFFREHDREAMLAGKPCVNEEWVTYASDGHLELLETIKTPMYDSQGRLIGVLGVARDITERERIKRTLAESEQEFRTLAENLPDNIIRYDRDCRVHYMNPSMARTIAPELLPKVGNFPFESAPDSGQIRGLQNLVEQVMDSGEREDVEFEIKHPDGTPHAHHVIFVAERDKEGRVTGALGIGRDISERKRMEASLAENELRYRTLFTSANDGIFILDDRGAFMEVNPRGVAMYGLPMEDLIGHTPLDFSPTRQPGGELSSELFLKPITHVLQGSPQQIEWQSLRADGTLFDVEITLNTIELRGKQCLHAVVRDITQRKQTEKQLEEYRQRLEGLVAEESTKFRALVEQSLVGIYIIQDGFFRYTNPGLYEMFGYDSLDDVVDTIPVLQFIKDEDRALVEENIRRRIAGEVKSLRYSFRVIRPDGAEITVDAYGRRIEYQGRPAIIGTLVDITEMRRSNEELERLVEEKSAELRHHEELLRTLIEAIPDAIEFKDGEGRWLESNSSARATFGLDVDTSQGKSDIELAQMVDPQYRTALLQCSASDSLAWQVGSTSRVAEVMQMPNGEEMTFDVIKVPLFNDDGSRKGLVIVGRDVSDLKRAEAALRSSLIEYSGLVQRIPVGVYKYRMRQDGSTLFDYVSPRWCELLGVSQADVLRDPQAAFARIHPEDAARFALINYVSRDSMSHFVWEGRVLGSNGEVRWLHIESQPTQQENGDIQWDGIQYDVTDRRIAEDALRVTASVFENTQDAIIITDANNVTIDVNPAFTCITGYSRDEVLGKNPSMLRSGRQDEAFYAGMWKSLRDDRAWRGEIWNRRKSGEVYAELLSISAICDEAGAVQRYVGVFSDITYFKEHEAELSRVANYDALTGVPNRRLLADRMQQALALAQRNGRMLAVCYIDLDGFKDVNDRYGHEMGDHLLVDITRRLQANLRAGDTLARLGGDEFVVLFNDLSQESECFQVLERIMPAIAAPMMLAGHQIAVSASVGVTFYPDDNEDADTLLRHADQAMYRAKQAGKNRYYVRNSSRS